MSSIDREQDDPVATTSTTLGKLLGQWDKQGITPVAAADELLFGFWHLFDMCKAPGEEWRYLVGQLEGCASMIREDLEREAEKEARYLERAYSAKHL